MYVLKSFAAMCVVIGLTGCLSGDNKSTIRLDQSTITSDASLSNIEKAEKLALSAEQLITPSSFMYADFLLDLALNYDPNNIRAKFYKHLIAPQMALKGAVSEVRYVYHNEIDQREEYEEFLKKIPNSELRSFLTDSSKEIKTEGEAQELLTKVYWAYDGLRKFLKENKDMDLTLNLKPEFFANKIEDEEEHCAVEVIEEGIYDMTNCRYDDLWQAKLDRADIEALQHGASGVQLYLTAYIAYDLSGANDVRKKFEGISDRNYAQQDQQNV